MILPKSKVRAGFKVKPLKLSNTGKYGIVTR